jgi:hypothetical protein
VEGRAPQGGWGTYLIRSLVDEVEFASTTSGHVLRMVVHVVPGTFHDAVAEAR